MEKKDRKSVGFLAKDLLKKASNAVSYASVMLSLAMVNMQFAYADLDSEIDAKLGKVLGVLCSVFRGVGIILLFASVAMMIMAFKDEDGASKTRAGMFLGISIVLISMKSFVSTITGISIS